MRSHLLLVLGLMTTLVACDGGSSSAVAQGDHCDTVYYRGLAGVYTGTLRDLGSSSVEPRSCEWDLTMRVTASFNGAICTVVADLETSARKLNEALGDRYSCMEPNERLDIDAGVLPLTASLESPDYPVEVTLSSRGIWDFGTASEYKVWPFTGGIDIGKHSPNEIVFVKGTLEKGVGL